MFGITFFSQYFFALLAGLLIGTSIGGGSTLLYFSRRFKPVFRQVWGQHVPRSIARSMTVSLVLSSILLTFGVLAFFGLLARNVSVTGMILSSWAIVFVTTSGLTLSVYIIVFMARKRREQSRRLEGRGMEGEEQSVRSRPLPVPKEAREEEQGPMER